MIRAALQAHAENSQRAFAHDRSNTVGASEIGLCARRVFYAKNEGDAVFGTSRDAGHEDGWGARARGTVYEDAWWYPALHANYGKRLVMAGPEQVTLVSDFLSATPDGVILECAADVLSDIGISDIEGDCLGCECKTIDPRARLDEAKPEHVYQAHSQLGLIRELTPYRPVYAVISYTNASFWDDVREFPIRFDERVFAQAKLRARDIMLALSADELRPEGVIAGGRECELCPYTAACGQARADRVPKRVDPVDPVLAETIADLARRARAEKEAGEARIAAARETEHEIRALLSEAGTRRLDFEGVAIRWSPVKGRPSWDMKGIREAAEKAGVDLAAFERTGDPTDRLAITVSEIPSAAALG